MKKVLLICFDKPTFVQRDIEILKKHYEVEVLEYHGKEELNKAIKLIRKTDFLFFWFADVFYLPLIIIAKLFRKKCIVVAGGYDCANLPEINYGQLRFLKNRILLRIMIFLTNKVLTVDTSLKNDLIKNIKISGKNVQTVHLGFGIKNFSTTQKDNKMILTVGIIDSLQRIKIKGIDTLINTAKILPELKFIIIGVSENIKNELQNDLPKNVELINPLPIEKIIPFYQKAKVYLQISYRESFGYALAEAMFFECFPIGTEIGGIKTLIGDAGFYVPYGDEKKTAEAIKKAINENGKKARERIIKNFSIEKREKELVEIINNL